MGKPGRITTIIFLLLGCLPVFRLFRTGAFASRFDNDSRLEVVRIQLESVINRGLTNPLFVTHARDGSKRLFIVEQGGRIKVLQPDARDATVFLDISSKVLFPRAGDERGLLGLAFHPQYSTNGRFFVNYSRRADGATVVAEYHVSGTNRDVADTEETVILTIAQPFPNHNGGMIEFGPDGYLYIGMGDGGAGDDPGNRAQNALDLLGKLLRIDIDHPVSPSMPYSVPFTNPYVASGGGREEIFALGLRNPWRFSFDRKTGEIWAGDVGQNDREEIDLIRLGGNYGWRVLEGFRCTNLGPASCSDGVFVPPVIDYAQTSGRCSVTGGYVYRGAQFSLPYGAYVFGDYCTGEIFLLEGITVTRLLDTSLRISSFGEGEDGEIYVVGYDGGTVDRITNPDQPSLTTVIFPRLATADSDTQDPDASEYTGLALLNLDSAAATLRFTSLDASGNPFAGEKIANPTAASLKPGEQLPVVDTEIFGSGFPLKKPVGWIKLESTTSKIVGFFLMFNASLSILDGATASTSGVTSFVFPEIEENGFTQIHIANPNAGSAAVTLDLVGSDGSTRRSTQRTISGNGSLAESVSSLFPGTSALASDYIRVTSNLPVAGFEYLGKSGKYVEGLNGQDSSAGSSTIYSPQYVAGGGEYRSTLAIVNLDASPGTVQFELIGDDGTSIGSKVSLSVNGRGKIYIADQKFFLDPGNSQTQGYVRVTSSGIRLTGNVVFGDPESSRFATALPLETSLRRQAYFSQVASDETYFTGIAILNPGSSAASVTLEVFDETGALLATRIENIAAGRRKSQLLGQYFPSLESRNQSKGYIRLTSDRDVASFALFGTKWLSVLSAIPAQSPPN